VNLPYWLGLIYLLSEVALRFSRRSGGGTQRADAGSLAVLWITITVGIVSGIYVTHLAPGFHFPLPPVARAVVVVGFAGGLALRWWAILSLGKFFTVDVAIAADHRLIVRGPYRLMRHPSYTGMVLAFAAFAATYQNWLSFPCVLGPILLALAYRIRVEEAALRTAFGEDYARYARTTKRLFPGVY